MLPIINTTHIRKHFVEQLRNKNFTVDKTGQKTIELIGASFIADEPSIFGTVNESYVNAEIEWYKNMSTNINDIWGDDNEPPKAWKLSANKHGEINSNYGLLCFSSKYNNQMSNAISELIRNRDSRRATIIYNRPSIWHDYNENGKNDFICTNAVTYYIRNRKVYCVVQMRSNDVIYGYKNDYAWQDFMLNEITNLYNELLDSDDNKVETGFIHWQVQNLHIYEQHFNLVEKLDEK